MFTGLKNPSSLLQLTDPENRRNCGVSWEQLTLKIFPFLIVDSQMVTSDCTWTGRKKQKNYKIQIHTASVVNLYITLSSINPIYRSF